MDHIDQVLDLLNVARVAPDVFVGENPDTDLQRVFGGQVMGQALHAMYATKEEDRLAHSMKSYFVRPGTTSAPLQYTVARTRDGGSFSSRNVVASRLRVSIGGLARGGLTEALTTADIADLQADPPQWLREERASFAEVRRQEELRLAAIAAAKQDSK